MTNQTVQQPAAPQAARSRRGVVFELHGLACHVCGRPAASWRAGVTFPCGCGKDRSPRPVAAEGDQNP